MAKNVIERGFQILVVKFTYTEVYHGRTVLFHEVKNSILKLGYDRIENDISNYIIETVNNKTGECKKVESCNYTVVNTHQNIAGEMFCSGDYVLDKKYIDTINNAIK